MSQETQKKRIAWGIYKLKISYYYGGIYDPNGTLEKSERGQVSKMTTFIIITEQLVVVNWLYDLEIQQGGSEAVEWCSLRKNASACSLSIHISKNYVAS